MKQMLDRIGVEQALQECGLPQPRSKRGYQPEQLIVQFFEHGDVTQLDPVLMRA